MKGRGAREERCGGGGGEERETGGGRGYIHT